MHFLGKKNELKVSCDISMIQKFFADRTCKRSFYQFHKNFPINIKNKGKYDDIFEK